MNIRSSLPHHGNRGSIALGSKAPMSLHTESAFESEICAHLAANGWLYADGDASKYDRKLALFSEDTLAWVQTTQPKEWAAIEKSHGKNAVAVLLTRVRESMNERGTLDVLRDGVEIIGVRGKIKLAQFKPALSMNAEILGRYRSNRLRVVRQVQYSEQNKNSIDIVLFLNGVPTATAELKTDFTQNVHDAVEQYKFDRIPKPKGQSAEPLLSFPQGALVHFAVSHREVQTTTRLDGTQTKFLPFNQGNNGAAGNPLNPKGHGTAYLWERVWQRESWLEILGRYLMKQWDKKRQCVGTIFPRFHQLDATRKLLAAVRTDGSGCKYLIQHSAGSGKTNSIAWTAHFLAELHDESDKKLFQTVLVISDRNVIDAQLQDAVFDFQRTVGVVANLDGKGASKSSKLTESLAGDKKIVVCTMQTFPYALKAVREMAITAGKRFAVIADEAHSSQAGNAAKRVKKLLTEQELREFEDGGEVSIEDTLGAHMEAATDGKFITYVAFTATPKSKTMELFGTLPDRTKPMGPDNVPVPFHVYSMRQAIEEGFILNVLENYTSYSMAFKLMSEGKEWEDAEVERKAAIKRIMGWVRLHAYNIAQKVEIVIEHFRRNVAPLLQGKAKAMVVVATRQEAVRWQLAMDKYIKDRNYSLRTLVAFSGEVRDEESGPEEFSEKSKTLNPNLRGREIREAFDSEEYQVLLVANKFQTGFDQPLLCGMYIDKRLAGIQAVQTLSRLNRAYPGKEKTYVLDFVDNADEVLAAFKTYYETAELANVTDPYVVVRLKDKLDRTKHYDDFEVDRVVKVELNPNAKPSELAAAVEPVVARLHTKYNNAVEALKLATQRKDVAGVTAAQDEVNALLLFKADMTAFDRLYTYLSQLFDYGSTDIEKRAIFFKHVSRLLDFSRERAKIDLSKVTLTHYNLKEHTARSLQLSVGENPKLPAITEVGTGSVQDLERALLREIIERVNELFDGELTDQDKLVYVNNVLRGKLLESDKLAQQALNNSKEQFAASPDLTTEILNAVMAAMEAHGSMSRQALNSDDVRRGLKDVLLGPGRLYEALRSKLESDPVS